MARVPQYQTPFSVVNGQVVEIEQDTAQEIGQCIEAVLRTPEGTLIDQPDFGRPDEAFAQLSPNPSADVYLAAVERWEPRAQVIGTAAVEDSIKRIVIKQEGQ
jgi:phage baseplate assembly protein W